MRYLPTVVNQHVRTFFNVPCPCSNAGCIGNARFVSDNAVGVIPIVSAIIKLILRADLLGHQFPAESTGCCKCGFSGLTGSDTEISKMQSASIEKNTGSAVAGIEEKADPFGIDLP